jgi:hypothetical protein
MTDGLRAAAAPLVILGASERAARLADDIGQPIIHVHKPGGPVSALTRGDTSYYSVDFAGASFDAFVEAVLRPLTPCAVVSLTETGILPAANANVALGLPGTRPRIVLTLNDKARTRECLAGSGAQDLSVRYVEPHDGKHAAKALAAWGQSARAILKPRSGSGSAHIELITCPGQLAGRGDLTWAILEEYIPGQEYSAETFSIDAKHRLIAVTEKHTDPSTFVELAHVIPATSLDAEMLPDVQAAISRFLDAVGLAGGPAHTEFKVLDGAVKVIESHSRPGGDGITRLAQLVTGFDLVDWGLRWPLGQETLPVPSPAMAPAAAIAFATAPPGQVVSVSLPPSSQTRTGFEDIAAFVHPGDTVRELRSSDDRVGCAMATGPDPLTALATARELASEINVITSV